jgi:hypothetical protein
VRRLLDEACTDIAIDLTDTQAHELVDEAVRFANPWAFDGLNTALPAGRHDLVRQWFRMRLDGTVKAIADIEVAARKIAPCPPDDGFRGGRRWADPTSDDVAAAHASQRRRSMKRREGTTSRR